MTKFKNKYRIESHRMPNWDYSGNGVYFLTIVTQNRVCNLGEILVDMNGLHVDMHVETHVETHGRASLRLSDFGKSIEIEFLKSFEIRNELFLDEYIIMPNHLHCIVIIDNKTDTDPVKQSEKPKFIRKPKSISSFMAGFKSAVNSKIDDYIDGHKLNIPKYNRNNHFFQLNYHDHIIRNNAEYERIKKYIRNNPNNWANDKLNNGIT